jgi:hypothetical protein
MSSRLCRAVGEGALAHSLTTFNTTYKDTGLFGVYTVCEPTKVARLQATGELLLMMICAAVTQSPLRLHVPCLRYLCVQLWTSSSVSFTTRRMRR